MSLSFRYATPDDFALLQQLEADSDAVYQTLDGFADLDHGTPITSDLPDAFEMGAGALIAEKDGTAVGMIYFEPVDATLFIKQISVAQAFQRQGIGAALMEEFWREATGYGLVGVTLCTYDEVPWNRPFYEKLGYEVLSEDVLGPDLARRFEKDKADWSQFGRRVVMGKFVVED